MELSPKKDLTPKFSKLEINLKSKTVIVWFHDNSRVVVELSSGNPLATKQFSSREKEKNSHAARFLKSVSCTELFNGRLYMKLKNGITHEYNLDELPVEKRLPAVIIDQINKSSSEHKDKECQIFVGDLFPNHYPLSLEKSSYSITQPLPNQSDFNAKMDLEIKNNIFIATLWANEHPLDIGSRVQLVTDLVQNCLDVMAFCAGHFYTASVNRVLNLKNQLLFDYPKPNIDQSETTEWLSNYNYLLNVFQTDKSWYLAFAVRDWKLSNQHPLNTGFYCRRALESLSHHVGYMTDQVGKNDKPKRWDALVKIIGMDDETFKEIKSYGGNERHGDNKGISAETRERFITQTKTAIDNYIHWLSEHTPPHQ